MKIDCLRLIYNDNNLCYYYYNMFGRVVTAPLTYRRLWNNNNNNNNIRLISQDKPLDDNMEYSNTSTVIHRRRWQRRYTCRRVWFSLAFSLGGFTNYKLHSDGDASRYRRTRRRSSIRCAQDERDGYTCRRQLARITKMRATMTTRALTSSTSQCIFQISQTA